jgi:hypothetical protein
MTDEISLNTVIACVHSQVSSTLGDEAAVLDMNRGIYYGLDPVGTRVWKLIQEPRSVAEVRDALLAEYEVEPRRCEQDLLKLLAELRDAGLIEIRGRGAAKR